MDDPVAKDVAAIGRIKAVPTILRTIRESTGLRFTLIARVLPDRWVACAVHDEIDFGLRPGGELAVATTLCSVVRDTHRAVIIDEVKTDPLYSGHLTPKMYGFESYISVPIFRRNGEYFGTVCGLDPEARLVSDPKTLSMMELFGELIALQLDAEEEHERDRAELAGERVDAKLREQFIAVLGHDVRGPLGSISMGTEIMLSKATDPADIRTLERVRSSSRRIKGLVDDLLDLARGRLGGGITIAQASVDDLATRLGHVVAEVQAVQRERRITLEGTTTGQVHCDGKRIEQLLSNLLANAVTHGAPGTPIVVTIGGDDGELALSVANEGTPIPEEVRALLFQPFFGTGNGAPRAGLGLGLYIVSEIAKSHGGRVDVASSERQTVFTFRMPRHARAPAAEAAQRATSVR